MYFREEIDKMREASFDFGKKPPVDGYTKVTEKSVYTKEKGFGLSEVAEADERKIGEKELNRDFLFMGGKSFIVDIENGEYIVRVSTGDYVDEGDVMTFYNVNGEKYGVWVSDGTVVERVFPVTVTDGKIEFAFEMGKHTCLNSIDIAQKQEIEVKNVKSAVIAKRDTASVKLTWDKADGVIGYRVSRRNPKNNEIDKVQEVVTEEFVDGDVTICDKFEYSVCALYAHKFCSDKSVTIDVEVVDGKSVAGEITELDAKETPNSVTLVWNGFKEAVWYNIYQKAPYGIYKYIGKTEETHFIDDKVITNVPFVYAVEAVTTSGISKRSEVTIDMEAKPKKRKMETLGRGAVAMMTENGVFLSWRLNAYEYEQDINFIILRNGEKITDVITNSTNYLDKDGKPEDVYTIKAVKGNKAEKKGAEVKVVNAPYISIPLDKPENFVDPDGNSYPYTANDASVADLDGDGEYEIILKWDPSNSHDNAHEGYTGEVYIDCYRMNGEQLWRINLGKNIRAGAHYTQFMVYDLDGDGKAEVVMRTADGTVDGKGKVIGNADADYREAGTFDPSRNQMMKQGRILKGKEYLTVFSGDTGEALHTIDYIPARGNVADWGDAKGNRSDRFLACVAYLDGVHPSVVMCRGYYTRTVLAAFDWNGKELKNRWVFDSNHPGCEQYAGQGNHNLRVGDVDGDGCDEIIYGSCAIDHNGKGLYSTRMGHGDAIHLTHFDPSRKGLQVWDCHENKRDGSTYRDAATGEVLLQIKSNTDVGRCMAADIDPTHPGVEMWSGDSQGIRNVKGEIIAPKMRKYADQYGCLVGWRPITRTIG